MDRVRESGGRADEWGGRRWDECGRVEGGWTEHGMRRTGSVNQCIGRTHSGGELGFWVSWYQRAGRSAEGRGTQGKREAEAAGMSRMSTTRLNYVFLSWQRESEKTKHSGEGGGGVKDGGAAAPVADWLRAGGGGDDGVGSWVSAAGAGCGQSGGGEPLALRLAPPERDRFWLCAWLAAGVVGGGETGALWTRRCADGVRRVRRAVAAVGMFLRAEWGESSRAGFFWLLPWLRSRATRTTLCGRCRRRCGRAGWRSFWGGGRSSSRRGHGGACGVRERGDGLGQAGQ